MSVLRSGAEETIYQKVFLIHAISMHRVRSNNSEISGDPAGKLAQILSQDKSGNIDGDCNSLARILSTSDEFDDDFRRLVGECLSREVEAIIEAVLTGGELKSTGVALLLTRALI